MITLAFTIMVLILMPDILRSTGDRYEERRRKRETERILRDAAKHGQRWG